MMKLTGFRVTSFRSIDDSGWIETDNITALIGTNESGKTNLIVPLWKLKPAKGGEIDPIKDYPRKRFNKIRSMKEKPVFIEALFDLHDELAAQIAALTGMPAEKVKTTRVQRRLDGKYTVGFPNAFSPRYASKVEVVAALDDALSSIESMDVGKTEEALKEKMLAAIGAASTVLEAAEEQADMNTLNNVTSQLDEVDMENALKRSTIAPRYGALLDTLEEVAESISKPHPQESQEARELIVQNLPAFVYYSNYGNLDSEIYLPHVIENLKRTDLGAREEAKARTLRVLFDFVNLKPEEILELGQDFDQSQGSPSEEQIAVIAKKKTERDILLQSAGSDLTEKFRDWWKQGTYRFRFQADGNHFRIWVSDDRRPEDIELESRSTGLQWFLSFYLIFLVESSEAHKGSILLLDEPGHSLHPLAQEDLSAFFENLANTNQLAYTTHSPFMVDSDHLDRVRAVYVNKAGTTEVTSNLRSKEVNPEQEHSIYPVHAAIGLSVSSGILQGCQPIVVEGISDQIYLSAIKTYLIRNGLITPKRELVFIPSKGTRGIKAVVSILTGKDDSLPFVLLDSDADGKETKKSLIDSLFGAAPERIILVSDICGQDDTETEDLFPLDFLARVISRHKDLRAIEDSFDDVVVSGSPIVPQAEDYAKKHGVELDHPGWKVDVAKSAKERILGANDPLKGNNNVLEMWQALFTKMDS